MDYPRDQLIKLAQDAVDRAEATGAKANVYFKSTCPKCGTRAMFVKPNLLYEYVDCNGCGENFPFVMGGFTLEIKAR